MEMDKAKQMLAQSGKLQEVRDNILEEKTLELILSRAEYVEGTPEVTLNAESGTETGSGAGDEAKEPAQDEENKSTEEL